MKTANENIDGNCGFLKGCSSRPAARFEKSHLVCCFVLTMLVALPMLVMNLSCASRSTYRSNCRIGSAPNSTAAWSNERPVYPAGALATRAMSADFDDGPYDAKSCGEFIVQVLTPVYVEHVRSEEFNRFQKELQKKTAKSVKKGEPLRPEDSTFVDPFGELSSYVQTGSEYIATVTIVVRPKYGETSGSFFRNIFAGALANATKTKASTKTTLKFKGNLSGMTLLRNADSTECDRGKIVSYILDIYHSDANTVSAFVDGASTTVEGKDQANGGIFQFDPSVFRRSDDGWPEITLKLFEANHEDEPLFFNISQKNVRKIWEDFVPYYKAIGIIDNDAS